MPIKIICIVGARPQFIKAAALYKAILTHNKNTNHKKVDCVFVHTGQHYDYEMNMVFWEELALPKPKYNLNIHNKSHAKMLGEMLIALESVLDKEKPQWVVVFGDTNSTLAGALAAKTVHIPVAHIEAGLRSFNTVMPEENNRILTDCMSNILFYPTEKAYQNLQNEKEMHANKTLVFSGDIMFDAFLYYKDQAHFNKITLSQAFVLCTIHREENTISKEKLTQIAEIITYLSSKQTVIIPMHPRTKKALAMFAITLPKNCICIAPVSYLEMLALLKKCTFVVTDSGGLQKEAFFAEKYCITLREETEWEELVTHTYNYIAGTALEKVKHAFLKIAENNFSIPNKTALYGNGNAGKIVVDTLISKINA